MKKIRKKPAAEIRTTPPVQHLTIVVNEGGNVTLPHGAIVSTMNVQAGANIGYGDMPQNIAPKPKPEADRVVVNQSKGDGWHRVGSTQPTTDVLCTIRFSDGRIDVARKRGWDWWTQDGQCFETPPSHWAFIPDFPNEKRPPSQEERARSRS